RPLRLCLQLLFTGTINRVIKRRATASMQAVHSDGQQSDVVGEVLRDLVMPIEAHYEGSVKLRTNNLLQEINRSLLLKIKAAAHRAAGVHQKSHLERQIGLAIKGHDCLRRFMVVQNCEIRLVQIAYEFAVTVSGNKENVDFVDAFLDGDERVAGGIGIGGRRCRERKRVAARGYKRGLAMCSRCSRKHQRHETKNPYVVHSYRVQNLHPNGRPKPSSSYIDARMGPKKRGRMS